MANNNRICLVKNREKFTAIEAKNNLKITRLAKNISLVSNYRLINSHTIKEMHNGMDR